VSPTLSDNSLNNPTITKTVIKNRQASKQASKQLTRMNNRANAYALFSTEGGNTHKNLRELIFPISEGSEPDSEFRCKSLNRTIKNMNTGICTIYKNKIKSQEMQGKLSTDRDFAQCRFALDEMNKSNKSSNSSTISLPSPFQHSQSVKMGSKADSWWNCSRNGVVR
jgi:hypothetical protein